jgi:hypothetical protein
MILLSQFVMKLSLFVVYQGCFAYTVDFDYLYLHGVTHETF